MNIYWNPDHVTPPGIIQFGEAGICIVRGVNADCQKDAAAILEPIEAKSPDEFIAAAVATNRFVESKWGVHPAVEFSAEEVEDPAPKKKKKGGADE